MERSRTQGLISKTLIQHLASTRVLGVLLQICPEPAFQPLNSIYKLVRRRQAQAEGSGLQSRYKRSVTSVDVSVCFPLKRCPFCSAALICPPDQWLAFSHAGLFSIEQNTVHTWHTVAARAQARSITNTPALAILAELGIYKPTCRKPLT